MNIKQLFFWDWLQSLKEEFFRCVLLDLFQYG